MTNNPVGRPLKFSDINKLKKMITDYFFDCNTNKRPYTISGLAKALGTNRQTLCNIENLGTYPAEFIDTIKDAKMECEVWLEENMLAGKANVVASIFSLKNNYGWKDLQQKEHILPEETARLIEERRRRAIERGQEYRTKALPEVTEVEVIDE